MKKLLFNLLLLISLSFTISAQTEEVRKIDEFENIPCDSYLGRMDGVFSTSINNPSSKIYVFVYEGKIKKPIFNQFGTAGYKYVLPQRGEAKARIRTMKGRFAFRKISLDNFIFVEVGFRENFTVEFWLVPNSATSPKPTPTLNKMRYRKGKPIGFCIGM